MFVGFRLFQKSWMNLYHFSGDSVKVLVKVHYFLLSIQALRSFGCSLQEWTNTHTHKQKSNKYLWDESCSIFAAFCLNYRWKCLWSALLFTVIRNQWCMKLYSGTKHYCICIAAGYFFCPLSISVCFCFCVCACMNKITQPYRVDRYHILHVGEISEPIKICIRTDDETKKSPHINLLYEGISCTFQALHQQL